MDADNGILLLDGALGTELDRRGVDISLPLWSARALLDAPQALRTIHEDYLRAGAAAITTCTFRTHRRSLDRAGLGDRARELTQLAVTLGRQACAHVNADALVLGSVAPLEECYEPSRAPDERTAEPEHRHIMADLLEAGVDLLLIETMGTQRESIAAMNAAQMLAAGRWMISFCMHNDAPPGTLLSGEPVADLLPKLEQAFAVGVNCVAAPKTQPHVQLLRRLLPDHVRVAAYANVGCAAPSGEWVSSDATDPAQYARYARSWVDAGATMIGGCCGTTPDTIHAVAQMLCAR